MPFVVFIFAMAYLSVSHFFRMHFNFMGHTADFTGPLMVITMKLTSFAFQIYDGRNGYRPIDPKCHPMARKQIQEQNERVIRSFPTILEYFGFMYSFININAGPIADFVEYKSVISGSDSSRKDDQYTRSKVQASLLRFFQGILFAIVYQVHCRMMMVQR